MAKKQFKAESKRLLDLMINSIYTHKEIFLREIISNASDACDKLCYQALTDDAVGMKRKDFKIDLSVDKENRIITVSDNGIGMDKEDLENNLGVIASSGSYKFKQEVGDDAKDTDVIGQFGVGFYSAFMVADHITVVTKKYGSDTAYMWQSAGADGYTITECEKDSVGTDIIMHVKPDTDDEKYSEFLESWRLQELVRKYSDYIRFPIRMEVSKTRKKEGCPDDKPEYETYQEIETLNSMVPIWQRRKSSVKPEEYNKFYRDKFHDYTDPQKVITVSAEGAVTYKALLFIPGATPYDYYTKEYEKGLQLYSNGVLIMDKCADLLPEHFRFVRGVVDSPDLSLNISRELLQHDRQLKVIATNLEKKIKNELVKMLKDDREGYETFWKNFGRQIKFGVTADYGANKDLLSDLLLFYSSKEKKLVTLEEYVGRMQEDQKYIYYASGEALDKVDKLPQTELLKDKDIEILYFTEDIDEFCAQVVRDKDGKELRSVLDQEIEEGAEKKAEEAAGEHKAAFDFVKEALGDQVKEVKASSRLKSHPVCLTAGEGLSFEMEKYFHAVQPDSPIKADRILELNVEHPAFAALEAAVTEDPEKAKKYATLLYDQALLIAGLPLEDPSAYTDLVCELMK
ncbi:molecular chaperone HtpG [Oscillibacter valericigenes]|uniref:molecular chaperone HtpG n=1 Tax=Oscillibacter valericigenes TaxID=351091 RepID=UPI001F359054|nr:molecular chaperone HtpG [Oscillibacter valericigenes]MCF2663028.1 molecular chaperone HtpG [Oscillibacter valericigenes]